MKWLIVQSAGQHDGTTSFIRNDYLRECLALAHALERLGHEAAVWGLRHANFASPPDLERFDVVLCLENYEFDWLPDFREVHAPLKLQWIIDLHCQLPTHYAHLTPAFDGVLHSTRPLIPGYAERFPDQQHLWFPNAVDDRYFDRDHYPPPVKTRDLLFVASPHPWREPLLRELEEAAGLERLFATGRGMIDAVRSARVHLNCNIAGDVNYRTFETIGLGTCLATNDDESLADLGFLDGVNCILYRSPEEARAKVRAALASGAWQHIAAAGYVLSKRHTYARRLADLIPRIQPLLLHRPMGSRR